MTVAAARSPSLEGPPGFEQVTFCGAGATSRVFRAVETRSGRVVALKRLHRQLVKDDKALARLKREFEALRLLRHEVLVQVADVVSWKGDPTLVMDFIEGEDLKETITRSTRLSAADAAHIGRALFSALALTHASGIVHRDIKPQNVRLAADGRVYLLDFGSARLDAASQLTTTGTTVGTPEYMPPELFAGPVYDPRVDVYGVGATLYECVTGSPPQSADSLAELAHLRASVDVRPVRELAPEVPEALARVIDRCLARAPGDRFPSAALATWSLDNPAAERALAARRSSHPLCLHCGTPIPEESATCTHCRSHMPFRYSIGPSHVVLRSVENVARFLEHVAVRFPDLAQPGELEALAERCAALSFAGQRYVSFVTDHEAAAIVAELAGVGARAEVVREPPASRTLALGLAFPLSFLLRIPLALFDAAGSMLSASRMPRAVMPRAAAAGWVVSVLALSSLVAIYAFDLPSMYALNGQPGPLDINGVLGVVFASAAAVVGASLALGHRRPRVDARHSPQPTSVVSEAVIATPPISKQRAGAAAPVWMLGMAVLMLFGECFGLAMIVASAAPVMSTGPGPSVELPIARPTAVVQDPGDRVNGKTRVPAHGPRPTPQDSGFSTESMLQLGALGMAGLGIAAIRRRRLKIRRDAAAMIAELNLASFALLARRRRPDRLEPRVAHSLSYIAADDAFVAEAIHRASDLMPLLSREQGAHLAASVEVLLAKDPSAQSTVESSLLSRCILEADPRHKLRLDLLAIEGQVEAYAATEWLARIAWEGDGENADQEQSQDEDQNAVLMKRHDGR